MMKSCLYQCEVMHYRLEPKKNRFLYRLFMFYLDLDELEDVATRFWLIGWNRFNLFSFWDRDHLQRGQCTTKENLLNFIRSKGMPIDNARVRILTHLRTWGHIFNPISIYFVFDEQERPLCAVAEVGNTFREIKPYLLGAETLIDRQFAKRVPKHFYVSPFMALDIEFDFKLTVPDESLHIVVDDYQQGLRVLLSSLTGSRKRMTNARLVWYAMRFPLVTLQVIGLIHWQAFILWLKGLPYFPKSQNPHLQQEVYRARH